MEANKKELTKPEDDIAADQPVVLLGTPNEGRRPSFRYQPGPALLTGRAIDDASAGVDQGEWIVNPKFSGGKDGIDLFQRRRAARFSGDPLCPPTVGEVAPRWVPAIADEEVISAPTSSSAQFQVDQIRIPGTTEAGPKTRRWVLRYGSPSVELEPQTADGVGHVGSGAPPGSHRRPRLGPGIVVLYMIAYYRLLGLIAAGAPLLTAAIPGLVAGIFGETRRSAGLSPGHRRHHRVHRRQRWTRASCTSRTSRRTCSVGVPSAAVDRSFDTAWGTIIKADVSSLIGAVILYLAVGGPGEGLRLLPGAVHGHRPRAGVPVHQAGHPAVGGAQARAPSGAVRHPSPRRWIRRPLRSSGHAAPEVARPRLRRRRPRWTSHRCPTSRGRGRRRRRRRWPTSPRRRGRHRTRRRCRRAGRGPLMGIGSDPTVCAPTSTSAHLAWVLLTISAVLVLISIGSLAQG